MFPGIHLRHLLRGGLDLGRTKFPIPWWKRNDSHVLRETRGPVHKNPLLSTSDFQSEVGEVFGKIGGELLAKFGR